MIRRKDHFFQEENLTEKRVCEFEIKYRSQRTTVKTFSYLNGAILDWDDLPAKLCDPFPINIFKNTLKRD
jgi:hypothetical protein